MLLDFFDFGIENNGSPEKLYFDRKVLGLIFKLQNRQAYTLVPVYRLNKVICLKSVNFHKISNLFAYYVYIWKDIK
jgi:hypothetical protein